MVATKTNWAAALIAIASGALVAGCGGNGADNNASGTSNAPSDSTASTGGAGGATGAKKLTGAGATFPYPLYSQWFKTYNTAKGVQINYQDVGSGAGIKQLTNKTVDFGASDAPVSDKDIAKMGDIVHIPTVGGAVVLAYNLPGAPKGLKMTGSDVANIFLGKIKTWNDPALVKANPGAKLPAQPITTAHRSDGSGTTNIFTNYLAAVSPEWKQTIGAGKSVNWPSGGIGAKGNAGVAGVIKQTPGAIGYVELAYAKDPKHPLTYASIQNKAGQYVEPSPASVTAAAEASTDALAKDIRAPIANASAPGAYPIAGFTYIVAYTKQKDAAKGAALKDFLKWAMTDGQKDAEKLLYAPLPASVVAQNEKLIDSIS